MQHLDKRIGELATLPAHVLLWHLPQPDRRATGAPIPGVNEPGDLLIIQKGSSSDDKEKLVFDRATHTLFISREACASSENVCVYWVISLRSASMTTYESEIENSKYKLLGFENDKRLAVIMIIATGKIIRSS